jgi:hypothetical protein
MYETFVALAYLRHGDNLPIEVGCATSYDKASELVRKWAAVPSHTRDIAYFRVERRYYV